LALTTYIEEARMKGNGYGKTGEHKIRGVVEEIAPAFQ
jgi:hypothetical protein